MFEIGDTAILLAAGWSPLKIAIFQLISASTAFIGLYVGISASESSEAAQGWILSIAAGLFLYVALADVVSLNGLYFDGTQAHYKPSCPCPSLCY